MKNLSCRSLLTLSVALGLAAGAAAASANANEPITLAPVVVTSSRLNDIDASIRSSLAELRQTAIQPVLPVLRLPLLNEALAAKSGPATVTAHRHAAQATAPAPVAKS